MVIQHKEYRDFFTKGADNSERLLAEYKAKRGVFFKNIQHLFDDYNLRERLETAQATGKKVRILQIECGEGLYLHDLAGILEKENLLEAADLYGIDANYQLIEVANQFKLAAHPPRPYLKFFPKDYRQSLPCWSGLTKSTEVLFDIIISMDNLFSIQYAHSVFSRFYTENLKPDGLGVWFEVQLSKNWQLPHPAFWPVLKASFTLIASLNPTEGDMAEHLAEWFSQLGALDIKTFEDTLPLGGCTSGGRDLLRDLLIGLQNPAPLLIEQGLLTQAQYDEMLRVVYKELTPDNVGYINYISTIARKPA